MPYVDAGTQERARVNHMSYFVLTQALAEHLVGSAPAPAPSAYGGAQVTNIRNVNSPHRRSWLSRRTAVSCC